MLQTQKPGSVPAIQFIITSEPTHTASKHCHRDPTYVFIIWKEYISLPDMFNLLCSSTIWKLRMISIRNWSHHGSTTKSSLSKDDMTQRRALVSPWRMHCMYNHQVRYHLKLVHRRKHWPYQHQSTVLYCQWRYWLIKDELNSVTLYRVYWKLDTLLFNVMNS